MIKALSHIGTAFLLRPTAFSSLPTELITNCDITKTFGQITTVTKSRAPTSWHRCITRVTSYDP